MIENKPRCKLIGQDGNVFNLIGVARKCLIKANLKDEAEEMISKVYKSSSYDEALSIITDYVDVE